MKQEYAKAFRVAFPFTVPVLAGYLFIGIAFGVMMADKGYHFLWAIAMSLIIFAGSGQYLAVNFFAPGYSFVQMIFLEFMVNIRHMVYGLSLLEKYQDMGKKKLYMIHALSDETYSLFVSVNVPKSVDEKKFLFAIAVLDQSYWVLGSAIGGIAGQLIPFNSKGIEFAMTALFLVLFTEQWLERKNHLSAIIGVGMALICLFIFGKDKFILPSIIGIMLFLLSTKKIMSKNEKGEMKNAD